MKTETENVDRRLSYAMVGGGEGSFIGPVHRAAIRMDDLADLTAGCVSRDAGANAATGAKLANHYREFRVGMGRASYFPVTSNAQIWYNSRDESFYRADMVSRVRRAVRVRLVDGAKGGCVTSPLCVDRAF